MSPEMMQMMTQMDFSQDKVQQQFSELGLKPEDVIQKVLATPDLASGFSNPKVQQAIFDISQNPMVRTRGPTVLRCRHASWWCCACKYGFDIPVMETRPSCQMCHL